MIDWIQEHTLATLLLFAGLILSLRLFSGIWLLPHNRDKRFRSKIFWSVVVIIPFFGALAYGALFRIPGREDGIPPTPGISGGGGQ